MKTPQDKPLPDEELLQASILIVDDDTDVMHILKRMLNNAGFERITTTSNVQAAIEKATNGLFDLIISDWNMPGLSGLDFLHQVRKSHAIPFIMLTSNADKDKVMKAIGAGVTDYVVKGTASRVLVDKVKIILSDHQSKKA